jgi:hypothetical protein
MAEVTIGREEFERFAEPYDSDPVTVLGILERNLESYARGGLDHDKLPAGVVQALRTSSTKELSSCH